MIIHDATFNYYSNFACTNLLEINKSNPIFIESSLRDNAMKGFGIKFSIYVFISKDKNVITYSPKYCLVFNNLKNIINKENITDILNSNFPKMLNRRLFEYKII